MENKLYRDEHNKIIGGVCAGLSDYFAIDVSLVRVAFAFCVFLGGMGVPLYIVLWIVVPPKYTFAPDADFTMPPTASGPVIPVRRSGRGFSLVAGTILVFLGTLFLLNQYNLIPDFDFGKLWPLALIIPGIALLFGSRRKYSFKNGDEPWDKKEASTNDNPVNL